MWVCESVIKENKITLGEAKIQHNTKMIFTFYGWNYEKADRQHYKPWFPICLKIHRQFQDFDLLIIILTSFILGLMILTTIIGKEQWPSTSGSDCNVMFVYYLLGNVFVMAAILTDRHLQSVANYLILSLGNHHNQ